MKNKFGKRYIRIKELRDYAEDLDITPQGMGDHYLEFWEKHGLLDPICRVNFPHEILRAFERDRYPNERYLEPIENDHDILQVAAQLYYEFNDNLWSSPKIFGEKEHVFDRHDPTHERYIQRDFSPSEFTPWKELRVPLRDSGNGSIVHRGHEQAAPTFYHYWQIFLVAALKRAVVTIHYPVNDKAAFEALHNGDWDAEAVSGRTLTNFNYEGVREYRALTKNSIMFDAVAYFEAYKHNTLQLAQPDEHGVIQGAEFRTLRQREKTIAQNTLHKFDIKPDQILEFIKKQCEWWDNAKRLGPNKVAEEYSRNIDSTIHLYQLITECKYQGIKKLVGKQTNHPGDTLDAIFPNWINEHRRFAELSLKGWIRKETAVLNQPFDFKDSDIADFCDWLEKNELLQFYWHFRRFQELSRRVDDPSILGLAAEVVSFANMAEVLINQVCDQRGYQVRGNRLHGKLISLFDSNGPCNLKDLLEDHWCLTSTRQYILKQRLEQIKLLKKGGDHGYVLRCLLSLVVIRNEGTHLGLRQFDWIDLTEMIKLMSFACLFIWVARK